MYYMLILIQAFELAKKHPEFKVGIKFYFGGGGGGVQFLVLFPTGQFICSLTVRGQSVLPFNLDSGLHAVCHMAGGE